MARHMDIFAQNYFYLNLQKIKNKITKKAILV